MAAPNMNIHELLYYPNPDHQGDMNPSAPPNPYPVVCQPIPGQPPPYAPPQAPYTRPTPVGASAFSIQSQNVNTPFRPWSTGLCGCFDDFCGCVFTYFCPCCALATVSKRLGEGICVPICIPGGLMALRTKMRVTYGIRGSIPNDCCAVQCCTLCAVCQMDRELDIMNVPK